MAGAMKKIPGIPKWAPDDLSDRMDKLNTILQIKTLSKLIEYVDNADLDIPGTAQHLIDIYKIRDKKSMSINASTDGSSVINFIAGA